SRARQTVRVPARSTRHARPHSFVGSRRAFRSGRRSRMTNMGRRQLIVVFSALAMVLLGGGVVGGLVAATQSDGGREWIRAQVSREANRGLRGRLHIGKISGSFLTDLTIDSIALSDLEDSVYIATGRLTVRYDP